MMKYFQNQCLAKVPDTYMWSVLTINWFCDEFFFLSNCSLCALQCQQVLCASRVTSPVIVEPTFSPNVIYCSPQQCAATVTWHFHNFTWPRANKFRPNLGEAGRTHRGVGVLQIIEEKFPVQCQHCFQLRYTRNSTFGLSVVNCQMSNHWSLFLTHQNPPNLRSAYLKLFKQKQPTGCVWSLRSGSRQYSSRLNPSLSQLILPPLPLSHRGENILIIGKAHRPAFRQFCF